MIYSMTKLYFGKSCNLIARKQYNGQPNVRVQMVLTKILIFLIKQYKSVKYMPKYIKLVDDNTVVLVAFCAGDCQRRRIGAKKAKIC